MIHRLSSSLKQIKSRLLASGIFGIVLLAALISPLAVIVQSQNASANDYSKMDAVHRLKARDAALILNACLSVGDLTINDVSGYTDTSEWFFYPGDVYSEITIPAYYAAIDNKLSKNKDVTCQNFFYYYSSVMGIGDPAAFLDEIGMKKDTDQNSMTNGLYFASHKCTLNVDNLSPTGGAANATTKNCILSAVYSRMGITGIPPMDAQMKYVAYKSILDAHEDDSNPGGCYVHWTSDISATDIKLESWFDNIHGNNSWDDGMLGEKGNWTKIFLVNDSANPTKPTPFFTMSEGGDGKDGWQKNVVVEPIIKVGNSSEPRSGKSMKCVDLANEISSTLSQAYIDWKGQPENAGETPTGTLTADSQNPGQAETSCAVEGVGWLVCPVMTFLGTVSDSAYKYIADSFLQVDTAALSTTSPTYTAWSYMRNIANVAFVIAFLIIIFSQLTGTGVANYGIKRMLPRLIIAAVLVNLSYFICQIAIDLSNIVGFSLRNVFDLAAGASTSNAPTGGSGSNWVGIVSTVLAGAAIGYAIGLSVLIPFLVGALIAVIMTFLILVIRQMLIILLVVVSPIAFVAYLLPNTEQWFKKWRKVLTSLLLVFPMVGLLFGGADLASSILHAIYSNAAKGGSDTLGQIIAQAIGVLPLFLLPSMLKNSLNAVGSIGTKINGIGGKVGGFAKGKTANSGLIRQMGESKRLKQAQIGAGIYSGNNLVSRGRSALNRRLNRSGAFNAVTSGYGTARGAAIGELEAKEIKTAEAAAALKANTGGASVEKQFEEALRKGDAVTAKATANILMGKGGPGVKSVRDIITQVDGERNSKGQSALSGDMRQTLSSHIMSNHAQTAKQKSADLLMWAAGGGAGNVDQKAKDPDIWRKSTASDLVGLNDTAFDEAMRSGGVSPETKAALEDARMASQISDEKRASLGHHTYTPPPSPSAGGTPSP